MQYQLILQFGGDTLADYDAMITLDDELIDELQDTAEVDGHDCGSGETNIFIFTSDPVATFQRGKAVIERAGLLHAVTAGYREVDGDRRTVIWPEGSQGDFRVT